LIAESGRIRGLHCALLLVLLSLPAPVAAGAQQTYQQSLHLAATGHHDEAIAALYAAASVMPAGDVWQQGATELTGGGDQVAAVQ